MRICVTPNIIQKLLLLKKPQQSKGGQLFTISVRSFVKTHSPALT